MTPFWSTERGHCPVNITIGRLIVALGFIAHCVPAAAQVTMPPESTRGLFGSGSGANAKSVLDLRVSLLEGYDSDMSRELVSAVNPTNTHGGGYSTLLDTGGSYAWRGKTEVVANVNSSLRYYADLGTAQSVGHSAGVGVTRTTAGGLTLLLNQSAAYTPAYFYGLFPATSPIEPGNPGVTAPNYTVADHRTYTYGSTASLSHSVGSRSNVTATGEFMYTDRLQETETWSDISSYSVRGRYGRNTTRNTTMSTELRYRTGEFGYRAGGKTTEVGLDVGFDYARPFSATRQATLSGHVGVSGADYPGQALGLVGYQRRYRTIGDASFNYPISHTWTATASIRRGLEYENDLPTPVVNNGASASVSGLLTDRVDIVFSGGYASGESILSSEALNFDTYTGDVKVRYAMSRTLAVSVEYFYYYYNFQNGALLMPGMPPHLERNAVRAGLTWWVPALRR